MNEKPRITLGDDGAVFWCTGCGAEAKRTMMNPYPKVKHRKGCSLLEENLPNAQIKTFRVKRNFDETGVSGTGIVLEGCVFTDGACVIRWCTSKTPPTTGIYDSYNDFYAIHIESHPNNKTEVIWD